MDSLTLSLLINVCCYELTARLLTSCISLGISYLLTFFYDLITHFLLINWHCLKEIWKGQQITLLWS